MDEAARPHGCGRPSTKSRSKSGSFCDEDDRRDGCQTIGCHCVVAPMAVASAALSLFLDVAYFPAGRDFTVAADHAAAREGRESEKAHKTHSTRLNSKGCTAQVEVFRDDDPVSLLELFIVRIVRRQRLSRNSPYDWISIRSIEYECDYRRLASSGGASGLPAPRSHCVRAARVFCRPIGRYLKRPTRRAGRYTMAGRVRSHESDQ